MNNAKPRLLGGAFWSAFSQILRLGVNWIILLVLARTLSPYELGVLGVATIITSLIMVIRDFGFGPALVHLQTDDTDAISTVFFLSILSGTAACLATYLLAQPISAFFSVPDLKDLLHVLSINFLLLSLPAAKQADLERRLSVSKIAICDVIAVAISGFLALVAVYHDFGIWSYVIQVICQSLVFSVLILTTNTRIIAPKFDIAYVKKLWIYSYNFTGFSIINWISRNADNTLIAKVLGTEAIGIYSVGYRIVLTPIQNLTVVMTRVLFPFLSTLRFDQAQFASTFERVLRINCGLVFPLMIWLFLNAQMFVLLLLGEQWSEVTPLIRALSVVGMVQVIVSPIGYIYMAMGRTDLMLKWGTINGACVLVFVAAGLSFGLNGVAIGYLFANVILIYPALAFAFPLIDLKPIPFLSRTSSLLAIAAVSNIVAFFTTEYFDFNVWLNIAFSIVLLLTAYSFGLLLFARDTMRDFLLIGQIERLLPERMRDYLRG